MFGKPYSDREKKYLEDHFRTTSNPEMASYLGRTRDSVHAKLKAMGLKRSPDEVKNLLKKPNSGQFTHGHKPHNIKFDGYERISKDGYIEIRVSEGDFRLKHRLIWEKHHGTIPKGFNVVFKDRNRQNTEISNLELISNAELCLRNENREKQSKTMKKTWSRCFSLHQMGIHRAWYRNK